MSSSQSDRQPGEGPRSAGGPGAGQVRLPRPLGLRSGPTESPAPPRRRTRLPALVAALVTLIVAVGAVRLGRPDGSGGGPALSEPRGPRAQLFALGRLEPEGETIAVGAPDGATTGRIEELRVTEGQVVSAGELLAILDSEARLLAEREAAARRLDQSRVRLRQVRAFTAASRIEIAADLAAARTAASQAATEQARRERLHSEGIVAREELDRADLENERALQEVERLEARLARYQARGSGEAVDVQVAREELAVAEAELREADVRLRQAHVRSPRPGTVLEVHRRVGEQLGGEPLLDLGATDQMMARLDVYETDVRHVRPGQEVRLSSDALERDLQGRVHRVGSVVRRQSVVDSDPAAHTDARVVEVLVALDARSSTDAARFVGLQVRARLLSHGSRNPEAGARPVGEGAGSTP